MGPGTVIDDEYTLLEGGRTSEHVVFSWGSEQFISGRELPSYERFHRHQPSLGDHLIVPYTVIHPATLEGVPSHAEWIDVRESPIAYWSALCDYWGPWNLTIVEHDVQAHSGVFAEFAACSEPWCYFTYDNFTEENAAAWHWGILGCTRFRKELIEAVPRAIEDLEDRWKDWHETSTGIGMVLREAGFAPHQHGRINHHRMVDIGGVQAAMTA